MMFSAGDEEAYNPCITICRHSHRSSEKRCRRTASRCRAHDTMLDLRIPKAGRIANLDLSLKCKCDDMKPSQMLPFDGVVDLCPTAQPLRSPRRSFHLPRLRSFRSFQPGVRVLASKTCQSQPQPYLYNPPPSQLERCA